MSYRILVTGSRDWTDRQIIGEALLDARDSAYTDEPHRIVVVQGRARTGADLIAAEWAHRWGWLVESHPASEHPDPKARNQHMVDLGADVCLAFATRWASGTGHCARAARRAGIRVIDKGVSTRIEDRP